MREFQGIAVRLVASVLMQVSMLAVADQAVIDNYAETRKSHFYGLYAESSPRERADIYCGVRFEVEMRPRGSGYAGPGWINIEHAYPAQWMATHLKCGNRKTCGAYSDPGIRERFNHAEADMHNMWPSLSSLNSSRGQSPYGEIAGEERREVKVGEKTFRCDFEKKGGRVEPRPIARGNLARSIFYMCQEYGFPVPEEMMVTLRKWNMEDLPTGAERARMERIAQIQGTRNSFVDDPEKADTLRCQ